MAASRLVSVAQKIIKPNSPTSLSLRRYNLSLNDQVIMPIYMPIAALYPFPSKKPQQVSNILQKSLSKVLSSYYPFAGRLRDNTFVDCNDRGAKFVNVRYDCPMSEVINLPDTAPEYLLFPKGILWGRTLDDESLLVVQLSHFNCGGLAVSASLSHKIADGCTLCSFIGDWASIARDHSANIPSPQMIGSSIFSPSTNIIDTNTIVDEIDSIPLSRKRYVFTNSKLDMLKSQVAETGVQNPTRLEVLSALMYKCATTAARANSSSFKPSVLALTVNLRPLFIPPLPTWAIGNIVCFIEVSTMSEDEMTIGRVVQELRKAKDELKKEDHVKEKRLVSIMSKWASMANEFEFYRISSVCNYPLMNNLDFGWGKPSRVTIPAIGIGNSFIFVDNQSGDGIEAIVSLPQKNVTQFENNKELLQFVSPTTNP